MSPSATRTGRRISAFKRCLNIITLRGQADALSQISRLHALLILDITHRLRQCVVPCTHVIAPRLELNRHERKSLQDACLAPDLPEHELHVAQIDLARDANSRSSV